MSAKLDECERMAKELSRRERARLVEDLVKSLDQLDENEYEELWIAEADRRYEEFKKGNISAKNAQETFQSARETLDKLK